MINFFDTAKKLVLGQGRVNPLDHITQQIQQAGHDFQEWNKKQQQEQDNKYGPLTYKVPPVMVKAVETIASKASYDEASQQDFTRKLLLQAQKQVSEQEKIKEKEAMRNNLTFQSVQEEDPHKKAMLNKIVGDSLLGDMVRKGMAKEGQDTSQINDDEITTRFLTANADKPEITQAYEDLINNKIDIGAFESTFNKIHGFEDPIQEAQKNEIDESDPFAQFEKMQHEQLLHNEELATQAKNRGVLQTANEAVSGFGQGGIRGIDQAIVNVGNFGSNLLGGTMEAVGKGVGSIIGLVNHDAGDSIKNSAQNMADNYKASAHMGGQEIMNTIDSGKTGMENSQLYQNSKKVGEVVGENLPALMPIGAGGALSKAAQGTKLLGEGSRAASIIAKYPSLAKIVGGVAQGAAGMAQYDVVTKGEIKPEDVKIGALFGGAIPAVGEVAKPVVQNFAKKLQISGLMTPSKLDRITNQLIDEGTLKAGAAAPDDVAKWMLERNMTGTPAQISSKAAKYADSSYKLVNEQLAQIPGTYKSDVAKKALKNVYKDIQNKAGLEDDILKVGELVSKKTYSVTELNQVKRYIDKYERLYTTAGSESSTLSAQGLRNIRGQLKTQIETIANDAGVANIAQLNNETQIARGIAEAVAKKESTEALRDLLTTQSLVGGGIGFSQGKTWEEKLKYAAIGAVGTRASQAFFQNKAVQTKIGSILANISNGEKKQIVQAIENGSFDGLKSETASKAAEAIHSIKMLAKEFGTKAKTSGSIGGYNKANDLIGSINQTPANLDYAY